MPKRQVHGRSSRQARGKLTPHQDRSDAAKQAAAMVATFVPEGIAAQRASGYESDLLRAMDSQSVTHERVQLLSQRVLGIAERALQHVGHHLIALQPGDDLTQGVKQTTTVAAILIDKWLLIQQQINHMEGKSGSATVEELNAKAARLLEITRELERRGRPIDVTPQSMASTADTEGRDEPTH